MKLNLAPTIDVIIDAAIAEAKAQKRTIESIELNSAERQQLYVRMRGKYPSYNGIDIKRAEDGKLSKNMPSPPKVVLTGSGLGGGMMSSVQLRMQPSRFEVAPASYNPRGVR